MTETEDKVIDEEKKSKKDAIRAILDYISKTEQLDLLEQWGLNRAQTKADISVIRKQVTEEAKTVKGQDMPPVDAILDMLRAADPEFVIGQLHRTTIGSGPKRDYTQKIASCLESLARGWKHQPKIHPDYENMPTVKGLRSWVDQWGYNVFETPKRRLADTILAQYQRVTGGPLYRPQCRPSDPVEFAPEPHTDKKDCPCIGCVKRRREPKWR